MLNKDLPDFYSQKRTERLFKQIVDKLNSFKNNEYFSTDLLTEYIGITEELENNVFLFTESTDKKINEFNNLVNLYDSNNETLRELNTQILVTKIERRDFGKILEKDEEEYEYKF